MKYLRTGFSQMKYDLASHGRSLYLPPTYIAAQFSLPPALFGSFAQFLQEIKKKPFSFLCYFFDYVTTFEIDTHKREGSGRAVAPLNIHTPSDVRSFKPVQKLPPDFLCNITWVVTNACKEMKKKIYSGKEAILKFKSYKGYLTILPYKTITITVLLSF